MGPAHGHAGHRGRGLIPAQICDAALDFMVGDDPDDDVAILAIHIERGS
jgi:peptidyl-tRNA hydrolase